MFYLGRKVELERARRESEQQHTQAMAGMNRKITAAQKAVSKLTMEKRRSETKFNNQQSVLNRQQERNQKLKAAMADLKKKFNDVVSQNAARARRGGGRGRNRRRDIGGAGCHDIESVMRKDLVRYIKNRVMLAQKAMELQKLIKKHQQLLVLQVRINKTASLAEKDSIQSRLETKQNEVVIGHQELELLKKKCGPKWLMMDKLNKMQRGSVVTYVIDEIISITNDCTTAERERGVAEKRIEEMVEEVAKLKCDNKALKRNVESKQALVRRMSTGGPKGSTKRSQKIMDETSEDVSGMGIGSPLKRTRARSASNAKENRGLGNVEKNKPDTDISDDGFCSGADAISMFDEMAGMAPPKPVRLLLVLSLAVLF